MKFSKGDRVMLSGHGCRIDPRHADHRGVVATKSRGRWVCVLWDGLTTRYRYAPQMLEPECVELEDAPR